ncbi:MAG: hypothetical protein HY510_01110 [Acidobacteria bacterium]|nr:hypothetical protein [Acidobacteriota bacterium]
MTRTRKTGSTDSMAGRKAISPTPQASDPFDLFETLRAYVGFRKQDSALLASFYRHVKPQMDTIIDDFYARIRANPQAARAITGGPAQVERLKNTLRDWLVRVLRGPHDAEFAQLQSRIGHRHVAVGLQQSYMVAGISVIREHLDRILLKAGPRTAHRSAEIQRAYLRLLDIALALMLETYREDSLKKILLAEQNATSRRLAALGEVAASIAHEIRNPLAGISGAIQVLGQEGNAHGSRRDILDEILREVNRLDGRVNDLLLYARPSTPNREPVRPRELLRSTVRALAGEPRLEKVRVNIRSPGDLPPFPLDPAQIQQVLVNLVLNAAQAMNGTGAIDLLARGLDGGSLEIAVEDSGPGVPPELVHEIFRPFFTTRRDGTGLGLAISRKIVEAHGGSLDVEARRGGGARFFFVLPPHPGEGPDPQE